MASPKYDLCQWTVQNKHASAPLHIPLVVMLNTPEEEMESHVRENTKRDLPWLYGKSAHDGVAIMVGGGGSVAEHLEDIRQLQQRGGTVFAINAASRYLRANGIDVDWQVTGDAKRETSGLIDDGARGHAFASHVHPETMRAAPQPLVWHSMLHCKEEWFPEEKRKRGGYALLGGEASSGLGALCVAYALGFRRMEIFGYDSCHQDGQSHAYRQDMNNVIPVMEYQWAGRTFQTSVTMRTQAERFPILGQALQQAGATLTVWGDGLLQHIWSTPPENLHERDKYTRLWNFDEYRAHSPGEVAAKAFLSQVPLDGPGPVIDFGCGTGRGGLALSKAGLYVVLVDFVSACRDQEALGLPFLEWDLTKPCPLRAPYGFCCDVLEHIPTPDVPAVLQTLLASCSNHIFLQISTEPDYFGSFIGQELHLTVKPAEWWAEQIKACRASIDWMEVREHDVQFLIHSL